MDEGMKILIKGFSHFLLKTYSQNEDISFCNTRNFIFLSITFVKNAQRCCFSRIQFQNLQLLLRSSYQPIGYDVIQKFSEL